MAFVLFILVNAALFIRPAEIVPSLLGWEIYFYLILACFVVAIPEIVRYLTAQSLETQPITLCMFGLLFIIVLPSFLSGDVAEAWRHGFFFAKVIVYYLLFVSLVTTPARLQTLLICIVAFCGCVTLLAVLRYHDFIELETMKALDDIRSEGQYGELHTIRRLQGTGIFHDPNELCVLLSAMIPLALYFTVHGKNLALRIASGSMLPLFGYAVMLTSSRGGFIAFAGGLGVLAWMHFGWRKTLLVGALGVPILLFVFGGRQTEISTGTGTASTRVELWRDWLAIFKENPLVGKGITLKQEDEPHTARPDLGRQMMAHNSYLQSFADLGIVGGCLFVGAFMIAGWSLYRLNSQESLILDPDMKTVQPFMLACLAAYGIGMLSLSICYIVPTFMMLALAVATTRTTQQAALAAPAPLKLDVSLVGRMAGAGVGTLAVIYIFVRFLA